MIDTAVVTYKNQNEKIGELRETIILDKYSKEKKDENIVVYKPSREINRGTSLIPTIKTVERIEALEKKYELKDGVLTRFDYAVDFEGDLNADIKKYRLFLECLNKSRGWSRQGGKVFLTNREEYIIGNIKIGNTYRKTTIYNAEDKERVLNIRFEDRTEIRTEEQNKRKTITDKLENLYDELAGIENYIEVVEAEKVRKLVNRYKTHQGDYVSFSEFISNQEENSYILTKNILVGAYKKIGMKGNPNNFIKRFRSTRPSKLEFVTKGEMKEMADKIRRIIKIELKELEG